MMKYDFFDIMLTNSLIISDFKKTSNLDMDSNLLSPYIKPGIYLLDSLFDGKDLYLSLESNPGSGLIFSLEICN